MMMSLQLGETFLVLRYRDQSNGSSGPKTLCFSNTMSYLKSLYPLVCKGFDNVNLGPVARTLVSANRWFKRGIKMYRFPWYLTLVSTNHASSNPGLLSRQHLFTLQGWGEGEGHTKANV